MASRQQTVHDLHGNGEENTAGLMVGELVLARHRDSIPSWLITHNKEDKP